MKLAVFVEVDEPHALAVGKDFIDIQGVQKHKVVFKGAFSEFSFVKASPQIGNEQGPKISFSVTDTKDQELYVFVMAYE